jgi:hypothetical protein
MAKQVQQRRGTTAEHNSFTGAVGELTVDTSKDTVVVHDGSTVGGTPLAKEADVSTNTTNIALKAPQATTYTKTEVDNKPSGFKNLIINGGFDVWQRGTSGTVGFTADRWNVYNSSSTTKDGSSIKVVSSTADPYVKYKLEDVGMVLANKQVTLSFFLKTSTGLNALQVFNYTGSGGYSPQAVGSVDSDGFQKYELTFLLDSSTYTNYHYFTFEMEPSSGVTIWLKNVQLELGSVATPFEQRPYGLELSLCQRYYQVIDGIYVSGYNNGHHANCFPLTINEMRVAPTVVDFTYHDQPFTTPQVATTIDVLSYTLYKNSISVMASSSGIGMIMAFVGNVKLDAEL